MNDTPKTRMTSIEQVMDMWEADAPIDVTEQINENARIPNLKSKYSNIMTVHSSQVRKLDALYKRERLWYWRFYMGKHIEQTEIDKRNPEFSQDEKIAKTHLDAYLDGEEGLNKIWLTKGMNQEIVDYCKEVIRELNNRTYQLTNMRELLKFNEGK